MNIYNNLNKEEKYCLLVRKLKDSFIFFNDDLLEVFPNCNNLFLQRIITHQLPDTSLYKILNKNISIKHIDNKDIFYLKNNLIFLKDYELYLNEHQTQKYFIFKEICEINSFSFDENMEMIWKWLEIISTLIKNINILLQ